MTKRMLIDAAHPEQTRVAVVDGNRVEEFDFESRSKKQIRGNIYLAKITRVEASLQAAFVDYGGNRHGFLAFNEIHPDYYQIPVEDRERLLKLEEEEDEAAEEAADAAAAADVISDSDGEDGDDDDDSASDDEPNDEDAAEEAAIAEEAAQRRRKHRLREMRRYKIQEVVKPGQVMLVQISKEERGNKGAALTTYLSLAGRYCVLMPNTARGGGISRKISNAADRKRLKSVTSGLDLPKGAGLIIRTAGSKRTKVEIKRDYEYLGRLWSTIREQTLASMAPDLVHEEGGLVRRAVRDLYDKEIEAVHVEGDEAYRDAREFMKMLMPSHAARVKHYKSPFPIFLKYQVEEQLEAIYDPNVRLKSGGYLVIHQTEALVAIDVNSGRSTRERNIEATALKTNLEAADEACRQMRLRDLAGLLVIDFIDMDENKNIRAVEKRMKDGLKRDRARVQMSRISSFGLMEISRQRRRASVIEGSSQVCPTCAGIGVVRSVESAALSALQALEGEAMKGTIAKVRLSAPTPVALYLLNEKRDFLANMERELEMRFVIEADAVMVPPNFDIEILERRKSAPKTPRPNVNDLDADDNVTEIVADEADEAEASASSDASSEQGADSNSDAPKKRRRGRRGGRGRRKSGAAPDAAQTQNEANGADNNVAANAEPGKVETQDHVPAPAETQAEAGETRKPRRRRRARSADAEAAPVAPEASASTQGDENAASEAKADDDAKRKRPTRRRRKSNSDGADTAQAAAPIAETVVETPAPKQESAQEPAKRPVRRRRPARSAASAPTDTSAETPSPVSASASPDESDNSAAKKRPVRRRRRSAKSAEAAPTADNANTKVEAAEKSKPPKRVRKTPAPANANSESTPAETAKPKARPTRRRAAKTDEPEQSVAAAPIVKEAPKPRKRAVRKPAAKSTAKPVQDTAQKPQRDGLDAPKAPAPKRRAVRTRKVAAAPAAKASDQGAATPQAAPDAKRDAESDGESTGSAKKRWWKGPFNG